MIVSVALSPSLDVSYTVDELRLGGIHRPLAVVRVAGGKALNAARAAATMGADVAAVAVLGGATGDLVAQLLAVDGVRLERVDGAVLTRTCTTIHSGATGELTEVYEHAVEVGIGELDRGVVAADRAMSGGSGWLVLSGGLPAGLPPGTLARLIGVARHRGFRVAVDTHGAALAEAVDASPDLVKVNRSEAVALLEPAGEPHAASVAADMPLAAIAASIRDRTRGGVVVITDGVHGSVAYDGTPPMRARLSHPVGQFPVGSGDSFLGGLVTTLDAGAPLEQAMRWAAACGTANALVPGAARFERATAEALVARVELTREPLVGERAAGAPW